jgi:hypothetical protein
MDTMANRERYEEENMSRLEEWKKALESEAARWSGMSCSHLLSELHDGLQAVSGRIRVKAIQYNTMSKWSFWKTPSSTFTLSLSLL